jgi:addiction module HigA family antidote
VNFEDYHWDQGERVMPMLNPPHPGEFIRTEIIEPLGLSVTAAAEVLGVSRPALSNLLNAKADLSGEMALRIEKAFGPKMDTSMRMQSAYDVARTRKREGKIRVRRYRPTEAVA